MCARRARSRSSWSSCVVRGDLHEIALPRRRGRVQHGPRYAVIVQADDLLALSTIVICPTSRSTPPASFHPEVSIDEEPTRRSEEHTSELQSRGHLVCRLLLEKKKNDRILFKTSKSHCISFRFII